MLAASKGASLQQSKDAMPRFLFGRLTAEPARGAKLFAAATTDARRPHWYVEGGVPDTLDGRFAMLATITALILVRIEDAGDTHAAVALTERFIEVMESEHRELGLGDPKLGRTVRKLVGSLARRTELWRGAVGGACEWSEAALESVYGEEPPEAAVAHTPKMLRLFWSGLERRSTDDLIEGRLQ